MGELNYVVKVPEPTLTNKELSESLGVLTATVEALRSDLVRLEETVATRPSLLRKARRWIAAKLAE